MAENTIIHEISLAGYKATSTGGMLDLGTWGSYGIEKLHLTLDAAWQDLTITAFFNVNGKVVAKRVVGKDGYADVPWEATKENTFAGCLAFEGSINGQRRISTNLNYKVTNHSETTDSDPVPTDDRWNQFVTETSLSKAFHLISRFSEDIDLILDWRVLGYGKDEPWEKRSNTKQDAFNKEANVRAEVFLSETFCPAVKAGLSQEIGCEANVYIDEKDKQTVIFAYPHLFTNTATLQVIRLEIGALAAWTPAKTALIEPYAAKYYPKIFEQKETAILTVAPERTFWEKATILHHEANRPEHLEMPQRYSRHYYDLYRMAATPVKEAAFSRLDLLKKVVDFKMKFYPRSWAKYPEAVPGTLKLLPPEYRFAALEADYNSMQDMLYGDVPTFETVIAAVQELEKEINTL